MSIANVPEFDAQSDRSRPAGRPCPQLATLPILRGVTVCLREVRVSDLDPITRLLADSRVTQYQLRPPPRTREEVEAWIRLMHRRRAENAVLCFAVLLNDSDTLIGIGQLSVPRATAGVEWGWLLDPAHWGSGVFPDLASVLRGYARAHYGVDEVTARVHVDNRRAARALQKLGSVLRSVADATMTWTTTTGPAGDSSAALSERATASRTPL